MKPRAPKIVAKGKTAKPALAPGMARLAKSKSKGKPTGFLPLQSLLPRFKKRPKLTPVMYGSAADFDRLPSGLRGLLSAVARRQLFSELAGGIGILGLLICGFIGGEITVDWLLELPQAARITILIAGVATIGLVGYYGLVPPFRHRLTAQTAALRVEGRWPGLKSLIITGVQFILRRPSSTNGTEALLQSIVQDANSRAATLSPALVVPLKRIYQVLLLRLLPVPLLVAVIILLQPMTGLLLKRLVGLNVPFPTQTFVEAVTTDIETTTGADVPISAKAVGVVPSSGTVIIEIDGRTLEERMPALPGGIFKFTVRNVQQPFHYAFRFNDASGSRYQVQVKPAPAIADITFVATPPSYTKLPSVTFSGGGAEVLAGSHLTIHGHTTLPLKAASLIFITDPDSEAGSGSETPAAKSATKSMAVKIDSDGKTFSAEMQVPPDLEGFSIPLVSGTDVHSVNDPVYRLQVSVDKPPTVAISDPDQSTITITPDGSCLVTATLTDDFGLEKAFFCMQGAGNDDPDATPSTTTAKPAPVTRIPIDLGIKPTATGGEPDYPLSGTIQYPIDLSKQTPPWKIGDRMKFWIEASDNNIATGPGTGSSDIKVLTVISKEDKVKEEDEKFAGLASELEGVKSHETAAKSTVGSYLKGDPGVPASQPPKTGN